MEELNYAYLDPEDSKGSRHTGYEIAQIQINWDNTLRSYVATLLFDIPSRDYGYKPFCIRLFATDRHSLVTMIKYQAKLYKPRERFRITLRGTNTSVPYFFTPLLISIDYN